MQPALDRFTSRRSTVYGQRGVVATSQPLASQAGIETLRTGGNAFDAAVATAAALNVVEPTSTGIGGDAFALYRTADGDVGAMRACGGAPAGATIQAVEAALRDAEHTDAYYPDDGGDAVDDTEAGGMPFYGPHAVTVPGAARGWEATVERHGQLDLATVLAPAIRYAMDGYPVSEVIASQWTSAEELFTTDTAREAFLFNGESPTVGQRITLPRLGESMKRIAAEGADVVYEGSIATAIATTIQRAGGFMTVDDLASFEVEWPTPVSTTYNGATVYELPPNNQGLIALEALNIAETVGAGEHPYDTAARVHYFTESMKLAFHDGHHYITDPAYESHPPLGSKRWAKRRAEAIGETAAFGVMGGYMQPQGHLQAIANVVDYEMPLQRALDEPRWRYREDGTLAVEPHFDTEAVAGLLERGHDVRVLSSSAFGGAQIARNADGVLSAATEPRKDGIAQGY